MKYYLYIFSILLFLSTPIENFAQTDQPKIGLVLSGGGARGFAHIGTLKLIDSLQIPIDYIVGTSMGGIIGGLYASGYTGNEIEKHVLSLDWVELLGDKLPRSETPYLEKKKMMAFFLLNWD
jgi:NTE family protein